MELTIDQIYQKAIKADQKGNLEEALISFKKVSELAPDYAECHYNLGYIQLKLNRLNEAEVSYKKAIELKPDYAEANQNLGVLLYKLHNLVEAEKCYKKAIELKPDYTIAYSNLGVVYFDLYRFKDAEVNYKKALELNPNFAEAYRNLGDLQKFLGKLDDALINYNHAYTLNPDMDFLLGAFLHVKMQLCLWDGLSKYLNELTKKIDIGKKVSPTFQLLSLIDDPSIHKKSAEIYSNHNFPKSNTFTKISHYHNHEKIKIGYFSPDFRDHPVSRLNAELYEIHDRKKFEIHAFSFGQDTKDEFNLRIKKGVDHFHDVHTMSDRDVVELARSLEIDIAVDLGGFTTGNRQGIFAMSAAPIQVNYLGYPGTMGVDYIDYLIADRTIILEEKQKYYSEKVIYMPNSYQANLSKSCISPTLLTRKEVGLPDIGFVFCCFNNQHKITPTTFAGWMRILKATDGSILWLLIRNDSSAKNLKKEAAKFGINENRLIFAQKMSNEDHLRRIQSADLFLDTLPYNAHTTASDALRIGLPVLTCKGNSFASRVAASLLNSVNLPEMITTSQDQYESFAIELATNPEKMKTIKDKLVFNLNTAPLYNAELYTRHLEAAYLKMHGLNQKKLNTDYIEIDN